MYSFAVATAAMNSSLVKLRRRRRQLGQRDRRRRVRQRAVERRLGLVQPRLRRLPGGVGGHRPVAARPARPGSARRSRCRRSRTAWAGSAPRPGTPSTSRFFAGSALHQPHHVVAEIAEQPGRHRRQAGRHVEPASRRSARAGSRAPAGRPATKACGAERAWRLISARPSRQRQIRSGSMPMIGIAPARRAALDALQQEGVRPAMRQLEEGARPASRDRPRRRARPACRAPRRRRTRKLAKPGVTVTFMDSLTGDRVDNGLIDLAAARARAARRRIRRRDRLALERGHRLAHLGVAGRIAPSGRPRRSRPARRR